jgi:hypothetical protein
MMALLGLEIASGTTAIFLLVIGALTVTKCAVTPLSAIEVYVVRGPVLE